VRLAPGRTRDLVVLGGAAFVLRLAWVGVYGRVNPPDGSVNDTTFYEFTAAGLANGHGYTGLTFEPTAGWPPVFPFLVSLLYRVFGERLSLGLALNVFLATATVILIYLIAERVFGRREARVAAGLFAILPGPLFMTGLFLSETTFIFMLVAFLALVVFLPDRAWKPVVLGVALGLAALTRGEGFLMLAIPLAAWWGHMDTRTWLRRAGVVIVVMGLTVVPWTIRNAIELDAFVPVSNNANSTLASAHSPNANGTEVKTPPSWTPIPSRGESENARGLRRHAIDWAVGHPLKEVGLIPRRLVMLNQGSGGSIGGWLNAGPRYQWQLGTSSILVFTALGDAFGYFLAFVTLTSLIVIGVRGLWHVHPAMQGVLAYLALCLVNYGVVYYGAWRYRIPMEPFMVLLATPLLVRVWERRGALRDALARLGPEAPLAGD
jgi:4-amino-4-deoxy-L-arabinose transferase-like glycosyltransferase